MRKLTWAALTLAFAALTLVWPLTLSGLHRPLTSISMMVAWFLLARYPPVADVRLLQRFLIASLVCVLVVVVANVVAPSEASLVVARVLSVAAIALSLWLVAGPAQMVFVAAGVLALVSGFLDDAVAQPWVVGLYGYAAALGCLWVAARSEGMLLPKEKKAPRLVVASNIVTLSPEEKAKRLAKIEARYQAGEIPEHKYWDLRQELESR